MCKETIASTCIEIEVETGDIPFDQVQYQGQDFTHCKEAKAQKWENNILDIDMVVFTLHDQRVLKSNLYADPLFRMTDIGKREGKGQNKNKGGHVVFRLMKQVEAFGRNLFLIEIFSCDSLILCLKKSKHLENGRQDQERESDDEQANKGKK